MLATTGLVIVALWGEYEISIVCKQRSVQVSGWILTLNPKTDITRSPKQAYHRATKRTNICVFCWKSGNLTHNHSYYLLKRLTKEQECIPVGYGSSRPSAGVCLSACWDTSPGVGLETPHVWAWRPPPTCGPGDPPGDLQGMLGYHPLHPLWTDRHV